MSRTVACAKCHNDKEAIKAWREKGGRMPIRTCPRNAHDGPCPGNCGGTSALGLYCDACWESRERERVIPILRGEA